MPSNLTRVYDWVSLGRKVGYSASELARALGISLRHLERHFKGVYGLRLHHWLQHRRLLDAAKLISSSTRDKDLADLLGYKTAAHFSREFKKWHGISPRSFRKQMKPDPELAACFGEMYRKVFKSEIKAHHSIPLFADHRYGTDQPAAPRAGPE